MKKNNSKKAFISARKYISGGVDSPVRSFNSVGGDPLFIDKGEGPYIYDIDGNKYLDLCMSWGALILGHAHQQIIKEVKKTINKGSSFGAPTKLETLLAKEIVVAVPSIEKVRFMNSGTEAAMSSLRLARAFTGREKIVKFDGCYHGHTDALLLSAGSGVSELKRSSSAGVSKASIQDSYSVPFNDLKAIEDLFIKEGKNIAAVIVEPVPANMGLILPKDGYLKALRKITKKYGALLIFDEVVTGFRLGLGGAQGYFGVTPDLTILGKIIGGGLPIGALGGKNNIMKLLAPEGPVYQAGTFSGNPLSMAAGLAALKILKQKGFYSELDKKSEAFIAVLREGAGEGIQLNQIGSMFTVFFTGERVENYEQAKTCDLKYYSHFYQKLLAAGIYFSPSQYETNFISQQHTYGQLIKAAGIIKKLLDRK